MVMVTKQKAFSPDVGQNEGSAGPGQHLAFGPDRHLRVRHFVSESYFHQAKMNLKAVAWAIQQYTQPGDLILDPMGGAGSVLWAASVGRRVVVGDIEPHWSALLKANCDSLASSWLFPISAAAAQWDAKRLPIRSGSVDVIVTSPPYWDMFSDWHIKSANLQCGHPHLGPAYGDDRGKPTSQKTNIGNIHIYELYLAAMVQVLRECWRILSPGGRLILFVKEKVHHGAIIPIGQDLEAAGVANGFWKQAKDSIELPRSYYRNVYYQQNPDAPRVDEETILVLYKALQIRKDPLWPCVKGDFALLQGRGNLGPGGLFDKALAYAQAHHQDVFILPDEPPNKCQPRKRWGFELGADLVLKHQIGSVDKITVYAGQLAGQYVAQRLETFGCEVVWPWAGLNQGQRLRWLTERGF